MYRPFLALWTLSIAAAAPLAWAQPASNSARSDPQNARASVPPVLYKSSLSTYRVLSDEKVTPWKETNDNVGRIGGWRAYAKEAQEPESVGDPTPSSADKPVPADSPKPVPGRQGDLKSN